MAPGDSFPHRGQAWEDQHQDIFNEAVEISNYGDELSESELDDAWELYRIWWGMDRYPGVSPMQAKQEFFDLIGLPPQYYPWQDLKDAGLGS